MLPVPALGGSGSNRWKSKTWFARLGVFMAVSGSYEVAKELLCPRIFDHIL